MFENTITNLQKKIEELEEKVKELMEKDFHYKEGDVVMLKDNLLLVQIIKPIKKFGRKYYNVAYNHMKYEKGFEGFLVSEEDLADKPLDYAETIFYGYLELMQKYNNLRDMLRK